MEAKIQEILLRLGADVCGLAHVDAFGEAPEGFHPLDIFSGCRSAVIFAKRMPQGAALVSPRIVYNRAIEINVFEVDRIASQAALAIEDLGGLAVPLPADSPYDYWDEDALRGQGLMSMRHAAVLAGLGTLGRNTLLLNKKFGNMLTIGGILTDLELATSPPAEHVCLKNCRRCLEACPTKALNGETADQKRCRPNTYETNSRGFGVVNCNICRVVCPLSSGLERG
ncbi:MAG: epoxyqueuosine reductase [Candidatus Adiutrix sp.]|jgi:epoxyqueuosine reductase QueG|nr:epoxyqueuosine reductase [Candidatus Adiutrix sp.]